MSDERIEQLEKRKEILNAGIVEFDKEINEYQIKLQHLKIMRDAAAGLVKDGDSWIEQIEKEKEEKEKNNKK